MAPTPTGAAPIGDVIVVLGAMPGFWVKTLVRLRYDSVVPFFLVRVQSWNLGALRHVMALYSDLTVLSFGNVVKCV